MDLFVNAGKSGVISRHISSLCGEARDATYTREADLKMWAAQPGKCKEQTNLWCLYTGSKISFRLRDVG
jgi:hypothetical protein